MSHILFCYLLAAQYLMVHHKKEVKLLAYLISRKHDIQNAI